MKIGIITYMQSNYGAVLQAFSLQERLKEKGASVEIIDFTTDGHLKSRNLLTFRKSGNLVKDVAVFLLNIIRFPQLYKRRNRTDAFKESHYNLTRRYSTQEQLLLDLPKEDLYVTGSDQVFNLNSPYYQVYYLGFPKQSFKKIAYAPSFGVESFSEEYNKVGNYVNDFDYLSCREEVGADFLSSITGRIVPTVVDPVLLHDAFFWKSVAVEPAIKDDYILVYDLNGGNALIEIANKIKVQTKCKIVCVTGNINRLFRVDKLVYSAGPAEFVGWFSRAKYVVTDSFHGTAFSIIFSKEFFTYEAVEASSSRLKNLLKKSGYENRLIKHNDYRDFVFKQEPIVKSLSLTEMIESSNRYIDSFLKSNEEL